MHRYDGRFESILLKQTKLKSLKLRDGYTGNHLFKAITNLLSELETLVINPDGDALAVAFGSVAKLEKLNHLTLQTYTSLLIETFAGLDNSRLITLTLGESLLLPLSYNVTPGRFTHRLIVALANSLPNLRVFCHHHFLAQTTSLFMREFNFVETLRFGFGMFAIAENIKELSRYFNSKLNELELSCGNETASLLPKLISIYPNLRKLKLVRLHHSCSPRVCFERVQGNGIN